VGNNPNFNYSLKEKLCNSLVSQLLLVSEKTSICMVKADKRLYVLLTKIKTIKRG